MNDAFWSPKFKTWNEVTINDVTKQIRGGKHTNALEQHYAFCIFDKVAKGERGTQGHFGEPWFDGLISMNRFGVSQIIWSCIRIKHWETRIDRYIDKIIEATNGSQPEPTGYFRDLYTSERTGTPLRETIVVSSGGTHDVYNAGMMIEARFVLTKQPEKPNCWKSPPRYTNYMA